ncbi:unnamed protein product, partial [Meganyctiphanes norvegica]
ESVMHVQVRISEPILESDIPGRVSVPHTLDITEPATDADLITVTEPFLDSQTKATLADDTGAIIVPDAARESIVPDDTRPSIAPDDARASIVPDVGGVVDGPSGIELRLAEGGNDTVQNNTSIFTDYYLNVPTKAPTHPGQCPSWCKTTAGKFKCCLDIVELCPADSNRPLGSCEHHTKCYDSHGCYSGEVCCWDRCYGHGICVEPIKI